MNTIRAKWQITIPPEIREAAHLAEGDPIEFEITEDGILLRPRKIIDATQAWFWTRTWQAGEHAASEDLAAGRVETFSSDDDFLASLDE